MKHELRGPATVGHMSKLQKIPGRQCDLFSTAKTSIGQRADYSLAKVGAVYEVFFSHSLICLFHGQC